MTHSRGFSRKFPNRYQNEQKGFFSNIFKSERVLAEGRVVGWRRLKPNTQRNKRQLIPKTHFLLFYFTLFLFYNKITHPCCQKTKLNTIKLLGGAGLNGGAVNFGASSASRQVPANFHPLFFVFVIEHNFWLSRAFNNDRPQSSQ